MEAQIITLDYDTVQSAAKVYFIESCGYISGYRSHKELMDEALQVLENCKADIKLNAFIVPIDAGSFHHNSIFLGDKQFYCTAFEQIPENNVMKIYGYVLTAGDCKTQKTNQAELYFADAWGNGFLEGARECLREYIKELNDHENKPYVTYSFGPGFYGMGPDRKEDVLLALDGNMIGVSVDHRGNISPEKSCCGFFLVVKDKKHLPLDICRDCIGNSKGCFFCGGKNITPDREDCMALLEKYHTPPHVIRHCKAVADTALRIAKALNEKGYDLDLKLLEAAALLHDICRTEENHGVKGAIAAEKHGYRQVAKLIKNHMYYTTDPFKENIDEQDILCLADRMVKEDVFVGLEVRMKYILDKFQGDPAVKDRIKRRMKENRGVKERIETIIGMPLDRLMK